MPRFLDVARTATAYLRARRHQRLPPPAIARLQRRGLLAHPGLARRLSAGAERGEPLQALLDRLPLSDPSALRQDFQQLNRLGLSLGEARARAEAEKNGTGQADGFSFGLSTGSEGEPSVFITSPAERAAYVGTVLGRVLAPGELAGRRAALLLKHDNTLYGGAGRSRLFDLSHFDIAAPLQSWIVRLIAESPDIVIGPPSVLLAASEHPAFASSPLQPRVLLTGAEPTFPSDARRLEAAYGVAPRPIYQTCEGFVAVACRFGTLHVNEDALVAEWRRFRCDMGRAAPAITDFTRTTQDVWRVLLHDIVKLGRGACPCGSTLRGLAGVEGRFSDVLYSAERGDAGPRFLFPFALDALIEDATPHDCEWRVEQDRRDGLSVATARELTARERARLRDALAAAGGWLHLRWDTLAPRPTAVKRRRFIRRIDPMSEAVLLALGSPHL